MMTDEQWISQLPQLVERFIKYKAEIDNLPLSYISQNLQTILERYELHELSSRDYDLLSNLCIRRYCPTCQTLKI